MTVRAQCPECGNDRWGGIVYHRDTNMWECTDTWSRSESERGCGHTWRTSGAREIDMGDDNDTVYCS